jgi:hypothetical protein
MVVMRSQHLAARRDIVAFREAGSQLLQPATTDGRGARMVRSVFDDVEARAWVLSVWIVRDVQLADEIVLAVSELPPPPTGSRTGDAARLLCEVHRRSVAAAEVLGTAAAPRRRLRATMRPRDHFDSTSVREGMAALPAQQRSVLELALMGGLDVEAIACGLAMSHAHVVDLLTAAMRTLQPVLRRREEDRNERYARRLA